MFFDHYPYTNFHNINLDWVLQAVKAWGQTVEANDRAFQDLKEANEDFKAYVTNYLQDLDITDEINTKLDTMLASGVLTPYFAPYVQGYVNSWLNSHVTPTSPALDNTLSLSGAAARADATGSRLKDLAYIDALSTPEVYAAINRSQVMPGYRVQGVAYDYDGHFYVCGGSVDEDGTGVIVKMSSLDFKDAEMTVIQQLGHANDITYYNGYLYVCTVGVGDAPQWGIYKINVNDFTDKTLISNAPENTIGITYRQGDFWLLAPYRIYRTTDFTSYEVIVDNTNNLMTAYGIPTDGRISQTIFRAAGYLIGWVCSFVYEERHYGAITFFSSTGQPVAFKMFPAYHSELQGAVYAHMSIWLLADGNLVNVFRMDPRHLSYIQLKAGDDLNDFTGRGTLYSTGSNVSSELINAPSAGEGFTVQVERLGVYNTIQTARTNSGRELYRVKSFSAGTWGEWIEPAAEVTQIKEDLSDDYAYHWGLGYPNVNGGIAAPGDDIALVTELIPVKKGMTFVLDMSQSSAPTGSKWIAIAEYADDFTLSTPRVSVTVPATTTPYNYEYTVSSENTKYIRFSYRSYGGVVSMTITRAVNASAYALADSYDYTAFNDYDIASMFEVGSWGYANGRFAEDELSYRVKSKDWLTVKNPTAFAVPTTFKVTAYYVAPDSYTVSSIAGVYSAFIPAGSKVRLTIRRSTENTSETLTDISEFTSALTVTDAAYRLGDIVGNLTDTTGYLHTLVDQSFMRGINHRGWHECPENTLIAFKTSRLKGFKWVECDIQFTSDAIPVILHDGTINRTARNSDGSELTDTVRIGDITYAQANAYDYGIYKGAEFTGVKLPTFDEFMSLCKRIGLKVCIEVKDNTKIRDTANVQKVVDIVKKYNMDNYVIWFGPKINIANIVAYKPSAKVGIQTSNVDATLISDVLSLKTTENEVFVFANIVNLTDAQVEDCMSSDIGLITWTLDTRSAILNANGYISGIISNKLNAPAVIYRDEMINT